MNTWFKWSFHTWSKSIKLVKRKDNVNNNQKSRYSRNRTKGVSETGIFKEIKYEMILRWLKCKRAWEYLKKKHSFTNKIKKKFLYWNKDVIERKPVKLRAYQSQEEYQKERNRGKKRRLLRQCKVKTKPQTQVNNNGNGNYVIKLKLIAIA